MTKVVHRINDGMTIHIPIDYKRERKHGINRWIEALRNPKYPQVRDRLCKTKKAQPTQIVGECCLGVYCRVNNLVSNFYATEHPDWDTLTYSYGTSASRTTVPHGKYEKGPSLLNLIFGAGVIENDDISILISHKTGKIVRFPTSEAERSESFTPAPEYASLALLNDEYNVTFEDIAKIVELLYEDDET